MSKITDARLDEMLAGISTDIDGGDRRLFNSNGQRLPFMADTLSAALTELRALRSKSEAVADEDEYTAEHAIRRARQIALQSEAAPLCMGEIIKIADMALGETTPFPEWLTHPATATVVSDASPDDIRADGWAVAVHNDYRLNGANHTFWLFTKGGACVKGEGLTDADALNEVRAAILAALTEEGA